MSAIVTGPSINKGRSRQDYGTPWEFIRAVETKWGPLVHDLACTRENAKASSGYYFPEIDALTREWALEFPVGNLWLNPPFADIGSWAAKCALEGSGRSGLIFLLTPASIGTEWFAQHVHLEAMVLGIRPRLTFEGTSDPYPKDLMLSVYGNGLCGFNTWRWDTT
jgi:phage N-6-adenine-methyltransferase